MPYHGKYKTPSDLLHDESLNADEKIKMLKSWRDDKEAYMRASDEGMQGTSRSEFLRLIKNALISLRQKPPSLRRRSNPIGPSRRASSRNKR